MLGSSKFFNIWVSWSRGCDSIVVGLIRCIELLRIVERTKISR
jgi:hypothetical protein